MKPLTIRQVRQAVAGKALTPIPQDAPHVTAVCTDTRRMEAGSLFVALSGDLGLLFGACANEYAPDDGRVVSADHGCGAHSEAMVSDVSHRAVAPVIDEFGYDLVDLPGVSVEETVFEPLARGAG